jgi:glycosyltransferase involved in cell wall biosynthesis
MKILHIITGLGDGGAENTLYKICKYDRSNQHVVISLKGPDKYFSLLKKIDIKVCCINMKFFSIFKFFYLIKLLLFFKPDIVQTWLVHGDFIGGIAARLAGIKNIVWNVRYSNLERQKIKLTTFLLLKILAKLSFFLPRSIVVVSKSARLNCIELGYCKKKLNFIPNGYDLSILKPNKNHKTYFKKKFKINKQTILIGTVARYDPKKDHINLLKAISLIRSRNKNFLCILVGYNIDKNNTSLVKEIKRLNLFKYVKLLGQKNDISQIMNGLDVYVQSSGYGEGFPNVVAESMACGTPCVVTDVGDAAFIVGKTGWIVPPKNSLKLAKKIKQALFEIGSKNWSKRRAEVRLRIKNNFKMEIMLKSYNELWINVCNKS